MLSRVVYAFSKCEQMRCGRVTPRYRHDLLLRAFLLLYSKSWLLLFVVGATANYGVLAASAYGSGSFLPSTGLTHSLSWDIFGYINWILVVPSFYVLLTRFTLKVNEMISHVSMGRVVVNPRMNDHRSWLVTRLDSPWIPLAAVAISIAYWPVSFRHSLPPDHWSSWGAAPIFMTVEAMVKIYLVSTFGARAVLTMMFLKKVFGQSRQPDAEKAEINIEPLHPDRCGGLSFLGSMSTALAMTLGILALNLLNPMIARVVNKYMSLTPVNLIEAVAYFSFCPLSLLLLLKIPHSHMKRAKDLFLADLSINFEKQYARIITKIRSPATLKNEDVEGLFNVREIYRMGQAMPVWPFDASTLSKYLTLVVIPLLVAIVSAIVSHRTVTALIP